MVVHHKQKEKLWERVYINITGISWELWDTPFQAEEKIKGTLQTPQVMEFPVTEIHRKTLKTKFDKRS
jgi:hypothetical protein